MSHTKKSIQATRRNFLRGAAAAALVPSITHSARAQGNVADSSATSSNPSLSLLQNDYADAAKVAALTQSTRFPLDVASGDVTSQNAMVWTYASDDAARAIFVGYWHADEDQNEVKNNVSWRPVQKTTYGNIHYELDKLDAGQEYAYVFVEFDNDKTIRRSRIGRFVTAPHLDKSPIVTVGATSCSLNGTAMKTLLAAGERRDLDLFLLLGDTIYADIPVGQWPFMATTLDDYRRKWQDNMSTAAYRSLRSSTSCLAAWDDHEFANNFDPETMPKSQFDAAKQAFFEHIPMSLDGARPNVLWRRKQWGKTLDVFVLDCRTERTISKRGTDEAEYISRAQMDWLKQSLLTSPCTFKLIMNSVPITEMPPSISEQMDRWQGYPQQRREILHWIDSNHIKGVLWLAGDFHLGALGRIALDGIGCRQREILAGASSQFGNPIASFLVRPQFYYAGTDNNYVAMRFDPYRRTVLTTFHGEENRVIYQKEFFVG